MHDSVDAQALTEKYRLGELLFQIGLLSRTKLDESLQIVDQTGLGIGRVMVLSQHITEKVLEASLQGQSLLKNNKVELSTLKEALTGVSTGKYKTFDEAMLSMGQGSMEPESKLGDLLVEAGLVSPAQLASALTQSDETGLPFGRMLVLSGVLLESTMAAAINAQQALMAGKVDRERAIKSLRNSAKRTFSNSTGPAERDFYQLPDRKSALLGELLVAAGSVSKPQLNNANELSVNSSKSLGQVLQEQNLISEQVLKATLELQEMVMSNKCSPADAAKILFIVDHERIPIDVAIRTSSPHGAARDRQQEGQLYRVSQVARSC